MTRKPETFFEEMKRYVGFSDEDARLLQAVGARIDPYLRGMSERFYDQITKHPEAGKVFTGGQEQIDRLKRTLQVWAGRLFRGPFDEDYAAERYKIGVRHVLIGLPQRYMISAMGVVRTYLQESLGEILLSDPAATGTDPACPGQNPERRPQHDVRVVFPGKYPPPARFEPEIGTRQP